MIAQPNPDTETLEARLGYRFRDPRYLCQALRHASAGGGEGASNERLEFLGDRVLGLCLADLLYTRFADASVGDLARRHAQLVSREALERVAEEIDLAQHIRLAPGTWEGGAGRHRNILADACEAVIGALYRDGGLDAALAFVQRAWSPLLAEVEAAPKDAKTALQEWAQAHGLPLPRYELVGREGPDHEPVFTVRASLANGRWAIGSGPAKRIAETRAAKALLDSLQPARSER